MSRLEKRLLNHVGRAVHDFDLIRGGDRIVVAVSGGKDSTSLLQLLLRLRANSPVDFSLVAVTVDQGQPGFPSHVLAEWFQRLGVEHRIIAQDVLGIARGLAEPGKTLCSICSRLRRGILYNAAVELKATKIALGHHREDLIETLLLSAMFSGALKSMPPKLFSDDGRNTVIRPMAYCPEAEIAAYAAEQGLPVIPCGDCAKQENLQRSRVKRLIGELSKDHPAVPGNLLNALRHVVPTHLLDPTVKRVDAASPEPE